MNINKQEPENVSNMFDVYQLLFANAIWSYKFHHSKR